MSESWTKESLDETGLPGGYVFHGDMEVTPRAVARELGETREGPSPILLDVREAPELEAANFTASVPEGVRVVHIPLGELEKRSDEFAEDLEDDFGTGHDHRIFVSCHLGRRSLRATLMLRALGFTDVWSIAGGIELWSVDVDPSVPRYD